MSFSEDLVRRKPARLSMIVSILFLCTFFVFSVSVEVAAQSPPPSPKPRPNGSDTISEQAETGSVPDSEPAPIEEIPLQAKPVFDLATAKQCEAELRRLGAEYSVLEPVKGEGQCGWPRPLALKQISRDVKAVGKSMLRCEVALALARWSKDVVDPSAKLHLGPGVSAIEMSTTYQCRRRNNAPTGKLSEHGFANGVDLLAFRLESGERVEVRDRSADANGERAFQAAIRGGACAYFTTVLGPMTDAAHAEHLHLDLAVRKGGYRLCE